MSGVLSVLVTVVWCCIAAAALAGCVWAWRGLRADCATSSHPRDVWERLHPLDSEGEVVRVCRKPFDQDAAS